MGLFMEKRNRLEFKQRSKTMNQAVGHGQSPSDTARQKLRELVRRGLYNESLPCPRCSRHRHLIFGLLKTPPVCIDCAVDPTWTNPQENWPKDKLRVKVEVFDGKTGPIEVIVRHPKYVLFQQLSGDLLLYYHHLRKMFTFPRSDAHTFENHVEKNKSPHLTSMENHVEKPSMQSLGQLQDDISEVAEQKEKAKQCKVLGPVSRTCEPSKGILATMLTSSPEELSVIFENHAKQIESFVNGTSMAQGVNEVNEKQVEKPSVPTVKYPSTVNHSASAYGRKRTYNQETEAKIRNFQKTNFQKTNRFAVPPQSMPCNTSMVLQQANTSPMAAERHCIQNMSNMQTSSMLCCALENPMLQNCSDCCGRACETNWTLNRDISQIQSEAMPINAYHAKLTDATDCLYRVPVQQNVHHTKLDKLLRNELSSWHQNNTVYCEFDQYNACDHVTNKWPHNIAPNYSRPNDAVTESVFYNQLPDHNTFPKSVLPKQAEPTQLKAFLNRRMATQDCQTYPETQTSQNTGDCRFTSNYCNEPFNPKQLPWSATFEAQVQPPREVMDLTYETASKDNHSPMKAAKLSKEEVGIFYPHSVFNSDNNNKPRPTVTGWAKPTEGVTIMASKMAAKENSAQIEHEKPGNQQTSSTFCRADSKSLPTCQLPSSTARLKNHAQIALEKLSEQEMSNMYYPYSIFNSYVANSEPTPVSVEQEEVAEKALKMATQENSAEIHRRESSNQKVGISEPCNQLHKLNPLPKRVPGPDHVKPSQKAVDLTEKNAFKEKKSQNKSTSTRNIPFVKTSKGKLQSFETVDDLVRVIQTGTAANKTVPCNKPLLLNTTDSTKEKDRENENKDSGPCILRHPKTSDLKFPDKTNGIGEAALPQKVKIVGADQENCNQAQTGNRSDLKEVTQNMKNMKTSKLERAIEIERRKLRAQQAIIKQLKELLTGSTVDVERAEDATDNEDSEKHSATNDVPDREHPRSKDTFFPSSGIYTHSETQTNTMMHQEVKKKLKKEPKVCSKRLRDELMPKAEEKKPNLKQEEQPLKEVSHPIVINKKVRVKLVNIAHCLKRVKKPEDNLRQARITPQHESSQASKQVYVHVKQSTADRLEKAKECENVLQNEESLKSSDPLPEEQEFEEKFCRKRHYSDTPSSESSKDDMTPLKNSFENQEFPIAAKKPRIAEGQSGSQSGRMETGVTPKAVQLLDFGLNRLQLTRKVSLRCPEHLLNFAKARNLKKAKGAVQTDTAKHDSYSNSTTKEEQPNCMAFGHVAMQQNKAKTPRHPNQEKGSTSETILSNSTKGPCTSKEGKLQKPLSNEATNCVKASVKMQKNANSSKPSKGKEKHIIVQNDKNVERTQSKKKRRKCSKDNLKIEIQDGKFQISTQTSQMPQDQNEVVQHHSKKVDHANPDYLAMCMSIERSIEEKKLQPKNPCTSPSQVESNEIKTETPRLPNQERKRQNSGDDDSDVDRTMLPLEKPQESKSMPDRKCAVPREDGESEKHPKQKSIRHSDRNQDGNNSVDGNLPPSIPQTKDKDLSKDADSPNPNPEFNGTSKSGTSSSDAPQDSVRFGSLELKKKPSTTTSQDNLTHLARSEMKTETPRIQSKDREIRKSSDRLQDREFDKPPSSNGHLDYKQEKQQRSNDSQDQNAADMVGISNFAAPNRDHEPQGVQEAQSELVDIQMHIFDKNLKRLKPHTREENIHKWSKILMKTVPKKQKVNKAKSVKWQQITNILAVFANPDLIFMEWNYFRTDIISKSICLMDLKFWNNKMEISIYTHNGRLWACVKERHTFATLQRRKYFIACNEQQQRQHAQQDGGFERGDARESYEDVKSHQVASKERNTGRCGNDFARSRREYWDRKRAMHRKTSSLQEIRFRREWCPPTRYYGPCNSFSRKGANYDRQRRLED